MSARYITTTLPYVNANPHLGHALEFVEADCLARAARLAGDEVFFNIGTDEHGAKVAKNAENEGRDPKEYVDDYSGRFKSFADKLNISYDSFIRTTDLVHIRAAQEFWKRCAEAGDIYKAEYEIKYCVGCELEKTDSELVDGHCPLHPNLPIEIRKEENYYFKFSKYQKELLDHYASNPDFVVPSERLGEITSLAKSGLKDFSISRKCDKLSWGIPVPGDEEHVMYVWFDALVNYISAIGWPEDEERFKKWWPVTQLAGKDNLRQQSAMWQAMLRSAGLPFSQQIFIHGFITSGGQKMSKTLGNIIDPMVIIEKYGVDALRYILLRHASPFEDSDLTLETIHNLYTDHLTNGLGNLVARVMKLSEEHLKETVIETPVVRADSVNDFQFNKAMDFIWEHIAGLDEYITNEKPFSVVKNDPQGGKEMISSCVKQLFAIANMLAPFMPETSQKIVEAIKANKKPENLFPRL